MKILLAAVNAKYIHSNLAVYSLRAYADVYGSTCGSGLQRPGVTEIAEYTINQPVDEILMDLYERRPDVVCFSCYLWNVSYVEQITAELAKILPETRIWLGGPEVSYRADEILRHHPELEGVMRGEGEETFLELTEYWKRETCAEQKTNAERKTCAGQKMCAEQGADTAGETVSYDAAVKMQDILGITWRGEDGTITENSSRPVIDLSRVPFVYSHIEDFRNRIVYYESSRGCPFSCSYCLSSVDKCLRFRDIELVKKELQFFIDHEVPQVKFVDRTFNCRHDHAMAIWTYISEHDRGITNFHFEVSADLLNEEEIRLIRSMRPGLIQLEIGVQSANERTIREIRRTMKLDEVEEKVARIREGKNVHQHLDLIAGLPFEDYESFARSFNRVYGMRPQQLQLGFLKVLRGSLMYERAGEYGLVCQDRAPYEVLYTKWLSYADVIRLKRVEEMVEVYYNSGQFPNTVEQLEREFSSAFAMYEAMASYYVENGLFRVNHTRIARYEILWNFIRRLPGMTEEKAAEYREWLTLDLYLRDNVKNRPDFLGVCSVTGDESAAFYKREEEERRCLKDYTGYDRRQMRKMTHLERIRGELFLFDYRARDPLTGNARLIRICGEEPSGEPGADQAEKCL